MSRTTALVLAALVSTMASSVVQGQSSPPADSAPASPTSLVAVNRTLQASLDRIGARSALWREAADAARQNGRQAVILTPDQVVVADSAGRRVRAFDPGVLAEVAPVPRPDSEVRVVLVVVNLPLLEALHDRQRSLPGEFHADLDRIIVHEVYGHAMPYLLAGDLTGRCPDPQPGQRASDACAIQRENAVRAELGLGRRNDYSLQSLWLARREWR